MSTCRNMLVELVDRTRELLQDPRESFSELAFHTALDYSWIKRLAKCSDTAATRMDAAKIAQLHDWLIVLELASDCPQFGPKEALLHFGEVAVYMYWQRQRTQRGGIFTKIERAHILRAAETRLVELRRQVRMAA